MGGQDGSRGYLFQTIIAVLNSLDDLKWDYVQIEPETKKDKVDVLWMYPNHKLKVVQVKSSINNFTKPEIIDWLEKLYSDIPNAESYKLTLIGNTNDSLKKTINKVSKGQESLSESLNSIKNKISIELITFNEQLMTSGIQQGINKFISSKNYTVDFYTLENIAGAIIYQFFNFGISGTKITREIFEKKLLEWLSFNYSKIFGFQHRENRIELAFYHPDKKFTNEIEELRYENLMAQLIEVFKEQIQTLFDDIRKIKIKESPEKLPKTTITDLMTNIVHVSKEVSASISTEEKSFISNKLSKYFQIDTNDYFYYVGNVKEPNFKIVNIYNEKNSYIGTSSEIKKRTKLDHLMKKLIALEAIHQYLHKIEELNIIPLTLRNIGNSYDENIRVLIKIPKTIEFIHIPDIDLPNSIEALDLMMENKRFFIYLFKHFKDSEVLEYKHKIWGKPTYFALDFMKSEEEIIEQKIEELSNEIFHMFNFDYHNDSEEYHILEFRFESSNPKENIAFPCYLFTNSSEKFIIDYEITSKKLNEKVIGKLIYRKE